MRAWAIWSVKSGSVGNRIFYAWMWWFLASSQGRSSVPSSALLRVGKSRKHSFNTEVIVDSSISRSWTPHAIFLSDRNDPLWECWYNLSNLTNQRVYQELVYRDGTGRLKNDYRLHRPRSPQFPPVLFWCSHFLNSADPTISEPGTGYDITDIASNNNLLSVPLELNRIGSFTCNMSLIQRNEFYNTHFVLGELEKISTSGFIAKNRHSLVIKINIRRECTVKTNCYSNNLYL